MESTAGTHALFGREEALALVRGAVRGSVPCALVGESGIGKTAIVAAAAADEPHAYVGGGLATLAWVSYLPLRRALGAEPSAGDDAHVADELAERVGDGLLVLDDLQWADEATRRVVELVAGRVRLLAVVRTDDPGAGGALELCDRIGAVRVCPDPLDVGASLALLRSLRADLPKPLALRLAERAEGNPLFLRELAQRGDISPSFRLALAARLRTLTPAARESLALLALLGRPAPAELLGAGVPELLERELADERAGAVSIRHSLFAEVLSDELDAPLRRRLHARLGEALDDPAEAAHHLAAAGLPARAAPLALAAAERTQTPEERAGLLALAAESSAGDERLRLSLRAARELAACGRYAEAERLVDALGPLDGAARAEAACVRWGTRYELGDLAGAHAEVAAGLAAAAGAPELEVELRLAEASVANLDERCGAEERLRKAKRAVELARVHRVREARAAYLYGTALYVSHDARCIEELERAAAEGRRAGDADAELTAAYNAVAACEGFGRQERARELAEQMVVRARDLHLTAWARQFRASVINLDTHAGRYDEVVSGAETLLAEGLDSRRRDVVEIALAVALIDLGRFDDAAACIGRLTATGADDVRGQGLALWLLGEAELWGGRPRAALAAVERFLGRPDAGVFEPFGRVVEAWARLELGLPIAPWPERPLPPIVRGVPLELAGLRLLEGGSPLEAAPLLRRAAGAFAGCHLRGELRCLLGEAHALREAGERRAARERLLALEQRADAHGMEPLLARIRRALRLVGVRRSAPRRDGTAGLTAREAEVLELAAGGLTNDAIASRLGVGRSTVKRLVASGARKLGAETRAQAVARFVRA